VAGASDAPTLALGDQRLRRVVPSRGGVAANAVTAAPLRLRPMRDASGHEEPYDDGGNHGDPHDGRRSGVVGMTLERGLDSDMSQSVSGPLRDDCPPISHERLRICPGF
jgi:hypothetical protein